MSARLLHLFLFVLASGSHLFAQADVASVKPSLPPPSNRFGFPTRPTIEVGPGDRISATQATLIDLVRRAYDLQPFQVEGGAGWMSSDRFDIAAKGDLRALLADRFKLRVRTDTREQPVYELVRARSGGGLGPRLTRSAIDCAAVECATEFNADVRAGTMTILVKGKTMGELSRLLTGPETRRPVLDRTGLTGAYDGALSFAPAPLPGLPPLPANDNAVSLFTALQEQFGLKLEPSRGPGEVLVIEGAEKPTEN